MNSPEPIPLGKYRGFETELSFDTTERSYCVTVKGETGKQVSLGDDVFGNITRIDNAVERFAEDLEKAKDSLADTKNQFATAQKEVQKHLAAEIKTSAYTLGKAPENLKKNQAAKLEMIANTNPKLFRGYTLKEQLRLSLKLV